MDTIPKIVDRVPVAYAGECIERRRTPFGEAYWGERKKVGRIQDEKKNHALQAVIYMHPVPSGIARFTTRS